MKYTMVVAAMTAEADANTRYRDAAACSPSIPLRLRPSSFSLVAQGKFPSDSAKC